MSHGDRAEELRVACAVEGRAYVRHCAAMLHSLLEQHPQTEVRIEYLHGADIPARDRSRTREMVASMGGQIAFHRVPDNWTVGLPTKGFTRTATWYRIFLEELIPDADRVLWLDADLLVLDSLLPLFGTPLDGHVVAAVTNVPPGPDRAYVERPELGGDPYFNAGVMVMDLAKLRSDGIGQALRTFAVRNAARLKWRDQDALNEVLHDRRLALHPRWNCMNAVMQFDYAVRYFGAEALAEGRSNPAIRHFEGPGFNKPWHLLCDPEIRRKYHQRRRQTPWPRVRSTGRTPLNLLRYARHRLS